MGARAIATHRIARWLGAKPYLYTTTEGLEGLNGEPVMLLFNKPDSASWSEGIRQLQHVRAWVHGIHTKEHTLIANSLSPDTQELIFADGATRGSVMGGLGSCTIIDAVKLALTAPQLFGELFGKVGQILTHQVGSPSVSQIVSVEEGLSGPSRENEKRGSSEAIVSLIDRASIEVVDDRVTPFFKTDGTYLITGGFGGFGLETATWLAKRGARYLALVGRRGAAAEHAKAAVQSLESQGVNVLAIAADMSDERQVEETLAQVANQFPPLKGVFHAAGILDDAPIAELNPDRIATVMKAKALSAWYLHTHTLKSQLDHFVLFSSVSSLIGNARQASYVAANTFLDALAHHRSAAGLAGVSVNWGAIATGMATENDDVVKHLELMGMSAITAEQALEGWAHLRENDLPQVGIMNCSWSRWREFEPTGGNAPRFSTLTGGGENSNSMTERCQAISELPVHERAAAMGQAVAEQVARVLRMPLSQVDLQHSLAQMGVDSLMSVELQAAIDQVFGVRISTLELMRSKNLLHLAELLMERTIQAVTNKSVDPQTEDPSIIDRMSALDIDILLDKMLQEKETA